MNDAAIIEDQQVDPSTLAFESGVPTPHRCKVRIHCGSAYVRGNARNYRYVIAQLFMPRQRADGVWTYRSTGIIAGPFRGEKKCLTAALKLAAEHDADFIKGYGSYHGKPVPVREELPLIHGN